MVVVVRVMDSTNVAGSINVVESTTVVYRSSEIVVAETKVKEVVSVLTYVFGMISVEMNVFEITVGVVLLLLLLVIPTGMIISVGSCSFRVVRTTGTMIKLMIIKIARVGKNHALGTFHA